MFSPPAFAAPLLADVDVRASEVVVASLTSSRSNVRMRIQTATAKTMASAVKKSGRNEIRFRG
ncbi:MAG: hypothetical protein JO197_06175 [Acidobacteria bacterium]|nr:hypothetical protein [Acidobacteriota bacterium]MBV9070646.1 hypothetical protein [Acidobacteriota bacterium]MBV9478167.1 hypothetical protein [Acidobacteriota bacterium]